MAVEDYDPIIQQAAQEWNVDPNLLKAVMHQESGGNPTKNGKPITSSAGAGGLMQIMPGTARGLGVADVHDPSQAIYGAAKLLNQNLERYGNPTHALMAYNANPDTVDAYIAGRGQLPVETQRYVPAVASHYQRFAKSAATTPITQPTVTVPDDFNKRWGLSPEQTPAATPPADDFEKRWGLTSPPPPPTMTPPASQAPSQPDYTGWDVWKPQGGPTNALLAGPTTIAAVNNTLAPAPNTTYGTVLPFAKDDATGALRPAMPSALRGLAQGAADLAMGPSTGIVTPEATMALTNVAAGLNPSVAGPLSRSTALPPRNALAAPVEVPLVAGVKPVTPEIGNSLGRGPVSANPNPLSSALEVAPTRGPLFAVPQTSAEAKTIASHFYAKADATGGTLTPQFTNKFLDEIKGAVPQTEAGKLVSGENPVADLAMRVQELRDRPITLKAAQEIDEGLGNLIDRQFGPQGMTKDGKKLFDLQSQFRDMIRTAGPEDITGGSEGFDALKQGRQAWAQAMKMADLERIITRANLTDNPATGIKSGIRTLLSNPTRSRGYSDAEKEALQQAADRGVLGSVLHVFGSRLIPLAAGAAGLGTGGVASMVGSGVAAHVLSTGLRNAASHLQNTRINNALTTLGSRVPGTGIPVPPWAVGP